MLLIALTGSIATGKSTASHILSSPPHSLPLIDADVLAREVVLPGTRAYNLIVAHFLPTTPDLLLPPRPSPPPSSSQPSSQPPPPRPLDRAALGRRVFGSSAQSKRDRAVLNSIVHPAVRRAMLRLVLSYHITGHWAVLLDIPLLYESALDPFAGFVILVAASPETQLQRLRARDPHLSEGEASDRVGSQMGVGEKVGRTRARGERGVVVWNEAGREELGRELAGVVGGLRGGWWAGVGRCWLWGSPFGCVGVGAWAVWRGWRARGEWEGRERRRAEEGRAEEEEAAGKEIEKEKL